MILRVVWYGVVAIDPDLLSSKFLNCRFKPGDLNFYTPGRLRVCAASYNALFHTLSIMDSAFLTHFIFIIIVDAFDLAAATLNNLLVNNCTFAVVVEMCHTFTAGPGASAHEFVSIFFCV